MVSNIFYPHSLNRINYKIYKLSANCQPIQQVFFIYRLGSCSLILEKGELNAYLESQRNALRKLFKIS